MDSQEREVRKAEWIEEHAEEWAADGAEYHKWRTSLHIGIAQAARELSVGTGTLRKFEAGEPVMRARLLSKAYGYYLEFKENEILRILGERQLVIRSNRQERNRAKNSRM